MCYYRTDSFGKGRGRGKASSPPPLPPRAPQWVAFDEPERRRPPRRITTLPYTYVNPEECTCECHEAQHRSTKDSQCSKPEQCSYPKKGSRTEKEKRYRTWERWLNKKNAFYVIVIYSWFIWLSLVYHLADFLCAQNNHIIITSNNRKPTIISFVYSVSIP